MKTVEELETIEILDIWKEEFGGIEIDWSGFEDFFEDRKDGDGETNYHKEKNVKAKRGRPRLKPLKPEVLSLRRDVRSSLISSAFDGKYFYWFFLQAANARERRRNDRLLAAFHR